MSKTVAVQDDRLQSLLTKEKAHDDYLSALRSVRRIAKSVQRRALLGINPHTIAGREAQIPVVPARAYALGYATALRDMATSTLEAAAARLEL